MKCARITASNCSYIPNCFVVFSCVVSRNLQRCPLYQYLPKFAMVCSIIVLALLLHVSSYCSTHHFTVRLRFMMTFVSDCAGRAQHRVVKPGPPFPESSVSLSPSRHTDHGPTVSQYQSALQASFKVLGTFLDFGCF